MTPRDLVAGAPVTAMVGSPEMDPLTEKDALQEARLNEVVLDAANMRVGLLFDLCGALQLRVAYTGLLVLRAVEHFSWTRGGAVEHPHGVERGRLGASEQGRVVSLRVYFFPDAEMAVVARSAAFFAGDVPGVPGRVPDFAWSDQEVAAGIASMDSPFEPTQATFIEPFA